MSLGLRPINIPQPEGSPVQDYLTVGAAFAERLGEVENRVNRSHRNVPDQRFIAAVVL